MWLFIEPLAMLKRMWPPPAPRSLALISGRLTASAHEIGDEQKPLLLALGAEIVRLAGKPVLEIVGRVEDELDVLIEVDHRRRIGDGDIARGRLTRAVEMLVPAIERNGEHGARLPFEGDAAAFVVPDRGRAAAVEHQDHLLEQLALRREFLARRNLADVAIVRGARRLVIDVDAASRRGAATA